MSTPLALTISLFLLAGNAFFVGAEFALISARRSGASLPRKTSARSMSLLLSTVLAARLPTMYVLSRSGPNRPVSTSTSAPRNASASVLVRVWRRVETGDSDMENFVSRGSDRRPRGRGFSRP